MHWAEGAAGLMELALQVTLSGLLALPVDVFVPVPALLVHETDVSTHGVVCWACVALTLQLVRTFVALVNVQPVVPAPK